MKKHFLPILLLLLSQVIYAQKDTTQLEDFVVTGTRFEIPVEKSGKTVFKYTQAELKNYAARSVADLLNEVPAIQVDGNFSNPGANLEYYIRGARSRYTLVLIDGVPMNDPTGISLFYDLRYLSLNQIESIEIVKGGLSALYGSNAAAGVISIKLKENKEEGLSATVGGSFGSFGAIGYRANVANNGDRVGYELSFNRKTVDGFSAAQQTDQNASYDDDGLEKTNFSLRSRVNLSDQLDLNFSFGLDDFKTDLDAFAFTDELNAFSDYQQLRLNLSPTLKHNWGSSKLNFQFVSNERDFKNSFPTLYKGQSVQLDQTNTLDVNDKIRLLVGWNLQDLEDQTQDEAVNFILFDPYASLIYEMPNGLNVHLGARLNTHSDYDNVLVYTVNPSWLFEINSGMSIKPFASFSSSYNTPSLYQINNDLYGNSNLNPEETYNWEIGGSFYGNDNLSFNVAFFRRNEDSAIDFRSFFDGQGNFIGGEYFNVDGVREVQGIELDGSYTIGQINLNAHYSKLATNNEASFARIPREKYGLTFGYSMSNNLNMQLAYQFIGDRRASPFSDLILEGFGLVNFTFRKSFLNESLSAFGAVNNLFDEEFIGVNGFTTVGRNFNIGIDYKF